MDIQLEQETSVQTGRRQRWPLRLSERRTLLLVVDMVLVNLAIVAGLWVWSLTSDRTFPVEYLISLPTVSLAWMLVAAVNDFYSVRVSPDIWSTVKGLSKILAMLLLPYILVYFLSPPGSLPRIIVLSFGVISFVSIAAWRTMYIYYLGGKSFLRRAIILGDGELSPSIPAITQGLNTPHYRVLGFVSEDKASQLEQKDGLAELGTSSRLPQLVQDLGVSEVILTSPNHQNGGSNGEWTRNLVDCYENGVQITLLPDILEDVTERVSLDLVENGWVSSLPLKHASTGVIFPIVKRFMDIVLACVGLLGFGLVLPFAALAIRLDSPGPIFYLQDRVGKGGKIFQAFKLRTMRNDAEKDGKAVWAERRDPRVTRVGKVLRATHLDEFPQLLNILKGDMSAVGPRPERPELASELDKAIPFYRLRHSVRPGMAGWALVKHGYSSSVEDSRIKLEYDLYYIKHQSIWFDIVILLKTVVDSVTLRGRF